MSGVRLRHPTLANVMVTVPSARRLRLPMLCSTCGVIHELKTYHLMLDDQGAVIVSQTIAERLRELPDMAGLEVVNEVRKPPPITLSLNGQPETFEVVPIELKGQR